MKCSKRGCCVDIEPEDFTDLYRIEYHHVHPTFMDNPKGKGKLIPLCRDHHIEILHPLLLEIIRKHSNLLSRRNRGANWIWKYHVLGDNKQKCINEVIKFTLNWLEQPMINSKKEREGDAK